MTREETKKILMVIDATYPTFKIDNISDTLDAWHFFLSDYDYNSIALALKTYVCTVNTGFAPAPNQLINLLYIPREYTEPDYIDEWVKVRKMISRGYYHAEEDFATLPDLTKRSIGSAQQLRNWSQLSSEEVDTMVHAQFRDNYKAKAKAEAQFMRLPIALGKMIEMQLDQIETNNDMAIEQHEE